MVFDNDVHAWTPAVSNWIVRQQNPLLFQAFAGPLFRSLFGNMENTYADYPRVLEVLRKIQSRSTTFDHNRSTTFAHYRDDHLQGVNILQLLLEAYISCDARVLAETLEEMGDTCVQGDSHRLVMLLSSRD